MMESNHLSIAPHQTSDCTHDGWLQDFDDDPSLKYQDSAPVGYRLKEQLAANEELPVRTGITDVYLLEKNWIAASSDYSATQPDMEIRYRL